MKFKKIYLLIFKKKVIVFTVAALTLERYVCLKEKTLHPNDKFKKRIILIYIILLWLLAIGFSLPKTLSIVEILDKDNKTACESTFDQTHDEIYTILKWILAFLLPYVIIIFFSCCLLRFLKEWSNRSKLLRGGAAAAAKNLLSKPTDEQKSSTEKKIQTNAQNSKTCKIIENTVEENNCTENSTPRKTTLQTFIAEDENNTFSTKKKNSFDNYNNGINYSEILTMETSSSQQKTATVAKKPCRASLIKKRTTRFALAIVISFLCTWSPFWIFQIIVAFTEYQNYFLQIMRSLTLIGVYMEGVTNPLLFLILTENFREFVSNKINYFKSKA